MSDEFSDYKKIFERLVEADRALWDAVLEIEGFNSEQLKYLIKPLMSLRGEIHVELMRPMYKKYPELADDAGFGSMSEPVE